jgi:hypothetical protein
MTLDPGIRSEVPVHLAPPAAAGVRTSPVLVSAVPVLGRVSLRLLGDAGLAAPAAQVVAPVSAFSSSI